MKLLTGFVLLCVVMSAVLLWSALPALRDTSPNSALPAASPEVIRPKPLPPIDRIDLPVATSQAADVELALPDEGTTIPEGPTEPRSATTRQVGDVRWADDVDNAAATRLDHALEALAGSAHNEAAYEDAVAAARRLEDWPVLRDLLRRRVQLESDNAATRTEYAAVLMRLGQWLPAAEAMRRVVLTNPRDARAWYNLAICQQTLRDLHAAVRSWKRVIELTPDLADPHIHLAEVQLDLHRWRPAADSLRRAIELDPAPIEPHHNLALALWNLNRPHEALDMLEQVLSDHPRHLPTLNRLADWSWKLFETDPDLHPQRRIDAERYCRLSIEIAAGQADVRTLLKRILDSTSQR